MKTLLMLYYMTQALLQSCYQNNQQTTSLRLEVITTLRELDSTILTGECPSKKIHPQVMHMLLDAYYQRLLNCKKEEVAHYARQLEEQLEIILTYDMEITRG